MKNTKLYADRIWDILYPRHCALCHEILTVKGAVRISGGKTERPLLCPGCVKKAVPVREPRCKKCGKPLYDARQEYCGDCCRHRRYFDEGAGIFRYDDVMRNSMAYFKYRGRAEYAEYYGGELYRRSAHLLARWQPQLLIPVPIHRRRMAKRGYNQAALLAGQLSRYSNIPVNETAVRRRKSTAALKKQTPEQRRKSMYRAFSAKPGTALPECVVIIDDIYTTGSTVNALAKLLKKCGAKRVYFLAVCIGTGEL